MNPVELIAEYYKPGSKAYEILLHHAADVTRKAVEVARSVPHLNPDIDFIHEAAMLHDIAIFKTCAPKLGCAGSYPYICHGYLGRELLEERNLPRHALVCERHVGAGISVEDVRKHKWPLPERDMVPVSIEEQIVCYADKFFTKKGLEEGIEKSPEEVLRDIAVYGREKAAVFRSWLDIFGR